MKTEHLQFLLRWIHFIAGIAWVGHLYFFNWVNAHFAKTMDGPTKKLVVPELMPRALFWFRWGAMFTFLAGVGILILKYFMGNVHELTESDRGRWILLGGMLGTIMWFNVWFIIWPRQKSIMSWIKKGEAPPEMAGMVKTATSASKLNTYLSVPMLFGMAAGSHAGDYLMEFNLPWLGVCILGGFGIVWCLYQISAKVTGIK